MSLYTVYRRNCCSRNRRVCIYNNMYNECLCTPSIGGNCCSRNRRVCIYNNMYNECLCTPSIGGTVVVVIVGFVFTTTCTMNVFVHRL